MSEGRKVEPGRVLTRPMSLLLIAGTLALAGCEGDTLYDVVPADIDPPVVMVLSPSNGSEVQAGQRVPIQVSATDEEGVSTITLRVTGVVTETIVLQFVPARTEVQADTSVSVPDGASGNIQIVATGLNTQGVEGQAEGVLLSVTSVDGTPPWVSLSVETAPRMELTDEIKVTVRAYDNPGGSGVASTGLTAIVSNTSRTDTMVLTPSDEFFGQASDTAVSQFFFTPPFVDPLNLPDTLGIVFFGIAYDQEGNCGGAVDEAFTDQVACATVPVAGDSHVVANALTEARQVVAVSGRTSLTPGGGVLADLLVDTLRSKAYVSNLSRNRVQVLEADPGTWGPEVWVGAEPWGLALNAGGDSLFVANSGSAVISFVSLVGMPREDMSRRLVTQNNPLYYFPTNEQDACSAVPEGDRADASFFDFSDRPQFVVQDAEGTLLFSTRPTTAAVEGNIRTITFEPGWGVPETKVILAPEDLIPSPSGDDWSIVHVDSLDQVCGTGMVEIFDHRPGFPDVVVRSGVLPLDSALAVMDSFKAAGDSDIFWARAKWDRERLAFQDTTFVTASRDREWVAFGEGGTGDGEAGRITLWDASETKITRRLQVTDLVNNASERVTALDLNHDGTLGAARGDFGSYYWSQDLRLLGSVSSDPGGAGSALHPNHPSFALGMPSSEETLSFVGQADHTIRILDTTHFTERGKIHIRDMITGPLKAGPPLPTDNDGLGGACVGEDCVVVKLYAITDAGGVVVVDVRRRDIVDLQ